MSKYYVYIKDDGMPGVAMVEKDLPLIGVADTIEKAEEILVEYLRFNFAHLPKTGSQDIIE